MLAIGNIKDVEDLTSREPFGHELAHCLLSGGTGLAVRARDLADLGCELVEEPDFIAEFDRGLLGAGERIPTGERRLLIEKLARALLAS